MSGAGLRAAPASDPTNARGRHHPTVDRAALWFGLFGAPFFWSAQLIATYALAARACFPRQQPLITSSSRGVWTVVSVVLACALVGAVAALMVSLANWRATPMEGNAADDGTPDRVGGRRHFMAYAGILLSAFFIGAIVLSGLALFLAPLCW